MSGDFRSVNDPRPGRGPEIRQDRRLPAGHERPPGDGGEALRPIPRRTANPLHRTRPRIRRGSLAVLSSEPETALQIGENGVGAGDVGEGGREPDRSTGSTGPRQQKTAECRLLADQPFNRCRALPSSGDLEPLEVYASHLQPTRSLQLITESPQHDIPWTNRSCRHQASRSTIITETAVMLWRSIRRSR